jgi:hypothetical protein
LPPRPAATHPFAKQYPSKRLQQEFVAEFDYRPTACKSTYRMVVLRKQVSVSQGQQKLFDDSPYFFYITNVTQRDASPKQVVGESNQRCDQENIIHLAEALDSLGSPGERQTVRRTTDTQTACPHPTEQRH